MIKKCRHFFKLFKKNLNFYNEGYQRGKDEMKDIFFFNCLNEMERIDVNFAHSVFKDKNLSPEEIIHKFVDFFERIARSTHTNLSINQPYYLMLLENNKLPTQRENIAQNIWESYEDKKNKQEKVKEIKNVEEKKSNDGK